MTSPSRLSGMTCLLVVGTLLLSGGAVSQSSPQNRIAGKQFMVARYTKTPPVIDGVFSPGEWAAAIPVFVKGSSSPATPPGVVPNIPSLPYLFPPDNPADSSFTVYTLYDDSNLYVAVDVKDDIIICDGPVPYLDDDVEILIDGDRRRASQILCQAVAQWILENIDGDQIILDEFGNCVSVDQDRSFFIDDRRVTTDWRAAWEARSKAAVSGVSAELIKAAARIPGVLQDLAAFVARVEAIPAAAFEGLVRNASFREDQLCGLFYLDAMGSHALGSIRGLEHWIAHLLARKATVRHALARRLHEVLGSIECHL